MKGAGTSPCNVTLPGRGTDELRRRSLSTCTVFVSNLGCHASSSLVFRRTPLLVSQLHTASSSASRCVGPIHHAEHDCKGLACLAGLGTSEVPSVTCKPTSPSGEALAHSPRCVSLPMAQACLQRSAYADQPDFKSGSASDSKTDRRLRQPCTNTPHTCTIDANVTLTGAMPRHVAVVMAPRNDRRGTAFRQGTNWCTGVDSMTRSGGADEGDFQTGGQGGLDARLDAVCREHRRECSNGGCLTGVLMAAIGRYEVR